MNSLTAFNVNGVGKDAYKTSKTLWVSAGLYTQKVTNFVFGFFKPTANHMFINRSTNLLHSLFLMINWLSSGFLHSLHMHYGYYELNTLNTNKEQNSCN